ncbi:MAG TPA: DUF2075 domain-containing protein [Gemmatimonadales bacterium]|nr:DUF2075 domain-containing protein [Gemmatimonadales bacterium]
MANFYYSAAIPDFVAASAEAIIGSLTVASDFPVETTQRDAWLEEIEILRSALQGVAGSVFLEFVVPRIGSRIDAVVISGSTIAVIEFKVGEGVFHRLDIAQAWDYALDLKNFHSASHSSPIVPILVATEASASDASLGVPHADGVYPPVRVSRHGLREIVQMAAKLEQGPPLDPAVWERGSYRPTPTIVEAAQALFAGHSVDAIARSEAAGEDLERTSLTVEQIIDGARTKQQKAIVFITGVPGAGKTLVGLNVATKRREATEPTHAVFLSGNGPLVKVLSAALRRDALSRSQAQDDSRRSGDINQRVKAFIQNVHHFRDDGLRSLAPPPDHVVIFDEAQRAWNQAKTAAFMKQLKGRPDFKESEPELLISYLDRHPDWAVVICLVGGGQEINMGEAGISAWIDAVKDRFGDWQVHISPTLTDSEYAAGEAIQALSGRNGVHTDATLHLATSVRSFRSEKLSHFVKAVLDRERSTAEAMLAEVRARYPLALTRDLAVARRWLRSHARGSERAGMLATSGAQRLRPHAIDVRFKVDPVSWFLNDPVDVRSSHFLEDAATEFQVQGLELDWTCVIWDADLRFYEGDWRHHYFRGTKWTTIKQEVRQQFLRNAYRVLLTRARQGMVICVPLGEEADETRNPAFYDATFNYLAGLGIEEVA